MCCEHPLRYWNLTEGAERSVFLHFHNYEIVRAYGGARRTSDELLRIAVLLTRYALVLSEGRLVILPKFLWECSYFDRYLNRVSPIMSAGLLAYAGSSHSFMDDVSSKQTQYRDSPELFPRYFDPELSERQAAVLGRLIWTPRTGQSATAAIASAWSQELTDGILQEMISSIAAEDRGTGLLALRELEAVPVTLEGRAFVLSEVKRMLTIRLPPERRTAIDWVINRAYLRLYISSLGASIVCDTPLGQLDFGLSTDASLSSACVSLSRLAYGLELVGLRATIERLPMGALVELRSEWMLQWLVGAIVADRGTGVSLIEVFTRDRIDSLRRVGREPQSLGEARTWLARLAEIADRAGFDVTSSISSSLGVLVLPAPGWQRRRRRSEVPTSRKAYEQMGLPGVGGLTIGLITITPDEMRAVVPRMGEQVKIEIRRRFYSVGPGPAGSGIGQVVLTGSSRQGGISASQAARDIVDDWSPDVIIVVGIGGGLPSTDCSLGDVVLARSIQDLRVRALLDDGSAEYSAEGSQAARSLTDMLAHLPALETRLAGWNSADEIGLDRPVVEMASLETYGSSEWQSKVISAVRVCLVDSARDAPLALSAPIVSTDALVKDSSFAKAVRDKVRHAAAFEMEAGGVFAAAESANGSVPVLVVKGISDIVGLKRLDSWALYAAESASSYAFKLMSSGTLRDAVARR